MQNPNPNPSKNSTPTTNKSPQDPPSNDESPKETNPTTLQISLSMEEDEVLKTALEVLVEFRARENGKLEANGDGGNESQAMKKRKSNILEYPHCHRCKHVFPTWAATMKHLQENYFCCEPNRFSAPTGFSVAPSTSTTIPPQPDQNEGKTKT